MFTRLGSRIYNVVSFGSGDPVLLGVGGWIGPWQVWRQPFELLSRDRRCVAFDHRGAGQTVVPSEELHFDGMVDDVFRLLDALGIERCWLAGESQGGAVALGAALREPARFIGLSLIGTSAVLQRTPRSDGFADALESGSPEVLRGFVDRCIPEPASDHLERWLLHMLLEAETSAAVALLRNMTGVDLRERLPEIAIPTQVIHGALDRIVPVEEGRVIAGGVPGAELLVLPGAGHVPTITHPEQVAEAMGSFIARHATDPLRHR